MPGDNRGVQVGQHGSGGCLGQLDPDSVAGLCVQRQQHRPPAAGRYAVGLLIDQAGFDQLGGDARDRGQAQVRERGDVGARELALAADRVEHDRLVDLADQLLAAST
jgi:hypothetical protein